MPNPKTLKAEKGFGFWHQHRWSFAEKE